MSDASPAAPVINGSPKGSQTPAVVGKTDATGPQAAADAIKTEPAKTEKVKLKIRGQEFDEDSAWTEIQRGRQASKLLTEAQKRAARADEAEKTKDEKLASWKSDAAKFIADSGMTHEEAVKWASKYLYEKEIQPKSLTEEQRQAIADRKEKEDVKAELAALKEKAAARESELAVDSEAQAIETEILDAIKASKIPETANDETFERIRVWMLKAEKAGGSLPVEQAAALAREDVGRETGRYVESAEVEELRELWGPKPFNAHVRKVLTWALGNGQKNPQAIGTPKAPVEPRKRVNVQQFMSMKMGRK